MNNNSYFVSSVHRQLLFWEDLVFTKFSSILDGGLPDLIITHYAYVCGC